MPLNQIKKTLQPFSVPEKSEFDILIVDDEFVNRFLLKDILEQDGYRTHEASNGSEALASAVNKKTDLILMDIMMPDMDGYETCQKLKENPRTSNIPVIFVTALTDTENLVKGFSVGAEDYLGKPINEGEVKARVQTHLKLKAAMDKISQYNDELEQVVAESSKELIRTERQAAFGQLIQGIVHNLKGPLTTIRGGSQACRATLFSIRKDMEETPGSDPDHIIKLTNGAIKAIELTETASGRLTDMINALMSKSSADQADKPERQDLNSLVKAELDFMEGDLHFKHHIKKNIDLAAEPIPIMAIAPEIAQVFNNILSNAIDAMHGSADQTISITTTTRNHYAWLSISDTGGGIAPENIHKIFDPFFTTKPKHDSDAPTPKGPIGTGLGLYMCMRSIKKINGDILVESTPDKGTTFKIKIPLAGPIEMS
ncbi:MAG: hybrid sensor histidine kinase/response regulator [Desulfobulbaceae bacterium]|nr:hybrid sensor histidine kinase/response regulator [Desulfobulbaceae bacterium]